MDLSLIFRSSMQINFGRLQRVRLTTSSSIPSKDMFRSHDVVARRRAYAERYAKECVESLRSVYEWNDRCTCIGQEAQHFRFFFLQANEKRVTHSCVKPSTPHQGLIRASTAATFKPRLANPAISRFQLLCLQWPPTSGASYDHPSL